MTPRAWTLMEAGIDAAPLLLPLPLPLPLDEVDEPPPEDLDEVDEGEAAAAASWFHE